MFLGAIFDDGTFLLQAAYKVALATASDGLEDPFTDSIVQTPPGDVFEAEKGVCQLLEVIIPTKRSSLRQHVNTLEKKEF